MTTGASNGHEDLFVADFYPQLGEYLAQRHATGYDAVAARTRFVLWLGMHAARDAGADGVDGRPVARLTGAITGPVVDYLSQVATVPRLSAEQQTALARRIEAGREAGQALAEGGSGLSADERADLERAAVDGISARNHLHEANLHLVIPLAQRYADRGVDFRDLIQAGNQGLALAVLRYAPRKGYPFETHATWFIRQAITRAAGPSREKTKKGGTERV